MSESLDRIQKGTRVRFTDEIGASEIFNLGREATVMRVIGGTVDLCFDEYHPRRRSMRSIAEVGHGWITSINNLEIIEDPRDNSLDVNIEYTFDDLMNFE